MLTRSILCFTVAAGAFAQSPAFEVAIVKTSEPVSPAAFMSGKAHFGTKIDSSRIDIGSASLFNLICTAYRVKPYQVSGPSWMKSAYFDVQAGIPSGTSTAQVPEMLQALLADRFRLRIHREKKDLPAYALEVMKGGPKLKEAEPDPLLPPAPDKSSGPGISIPTADGDVKVEHASSGVELSGGDIGGKIRIVGMGTASMRMESTKTTMKSLAEMLSGGMLDRPVVDMTGLKGFYQIALDVSREELMGALQVTGVNFPMGMGREMGREMGRGGATPVEPEVSSVFSSLRDLGLHLEPRRLPVDLIVVDSVERAPSAN